MSDAGKIKCIFFAEFHPEKGHQIFFQVPEEYITKDVFEAVHVYIITKPQLANRLITINALGYKIIGCPVCISDDTKYTRNFLMFNLCFVFSEEATINQYAPVIKKVAHYLTTLEVEDEFLSNEKTKERLPDILKEILQGLNDKGFCSIPINEANTIHLKVTSDSEVPIVVSGNDVPIFCGQKDKFVPSEWDLTTQQIFPYINGFNHVARIAAEADVELNLVKICIRNLVFFEEIQLLPVFQYSNVYTTTPKITDFSSNEALQQECISYVSKHDKSLPSLRDVFTLYCNLTQGTTLKDLCERYNPSSLKIDERRLIQFGLMNDIIRKLNKYPIKLPSQYGQHNSKLYKHFTGTHTFDEICTEIGISHNELDEKIENDPSVVICWK